MTKTASIDVGALIEGQTFGRFQTGLMFWICAFMLIEGYDMQVVGYAAPAMAEGEVDAVLSAHPPDCFESGKANITRLFEDTMTVEADYYRATGIFPIMHVIALKRTVVEAHPWIAMNLFKAFEEAKQRSVARALEVTAPRFPIPWCFEHTRQAQQLFGQDHWPYGVEANRTTLQAFLQYAHEQGVCHRRLAAEDLFPEQVLSRVRV